MDTLAKQPELTEDEITCLTIAGNGENMLAIARWEKPIDHLVELGLMRRLDKFNNLITANGKQVLEMALEGQHHEYTRLSNDVALAKQDYANEMEQAAQHLANATRVKQRLTGQFPNQAAYGLAQEALRRALEILG
jgi:DNA-binding TFAR19-related protein (PDSD5 family)